MSAERYIREWLRNQAAGGYVTYDPETERTSCRPSRPWRSPTKTARVYLLGAFELSRPCRRRGQDPRGLQDRRRHRLARARPSPVPRHGALLPSRLQRPPGRRVDPGARRRASRSSSAGAKVADVGCGHGASTIIMAEAFPNSEFYRLRLPRRRRSSSAQARPRTGVGDRITFEVASAKDFPGSDYDLVCVFDCLHDMGDPVGAAAHIRDSLADDGTWMIVEPFAADRSRTTSTRSAGCSTAHRRWSARRPRSRRRSDSRSGAQAGEARLREVIKEGGFSACAARPRRRSTSSSKRSPSVLASHGLA